MPQDYAWERFATEERKVSWDGYISYDGVLYGLPSEPAVAGKPVQVRDHQGQLAIWFAGQCLLRVTKRPHSHTIVAHPDQFRTSASVSASRRGSEPVGHQMTPPVVAQRPLAEYDRLCGVEGRS